MAHAQQQVLDALQTLLAAGGTVAGSRVYVDQVDPVQAHELPAILIEEEDGETSEPATVGNIEQRELSVQVSCMLEDSTTAAAQAREFGLAVEKLIAGSAAIAAIARLGWNITSSRQVNNGAADRLFASRVQSWRFVYMVAATAPDVIL